MSLSGPGAQGAAVLFLLGSIAYAFPLTVPLAAREQVASTQTAATADSFRFTTRNFANYLPVFLGNGYLSKATTWNGTGASASVLAGLYDHLEDSAYTYQALIPEWSEIDYWNGFHWLNRLPREQFRADGYLQRLDTYRGLLFTRYDWVDSNLTTRVEVESFVARQDRHIAVVNIKLTPDYGVEAGPVTVSFPLGGGEHNGFVWEGAELEGAIPIRKAEADPDRRGFVALAETRDGKMQVAQAVRVVLASNLRLPQVSLGFVRSPDRPALNVKFIVHKGGTYEFTKFIAIVPSRDSKSPLDEARAKAAEAERLGYENVRTGHERAWQELWRSDVIINGDVEAQRAVHAALFFLLSSLREDVSWSLPAVALPSRAYLGRIWWDADTWVFPSLLVLHPSLARSAVAYRCRMLPAAKRNAEQRGSRGALFPMESADTGQEEAPEWSSEIHVTGDVAMAQWRYFQATGDRDWLRDCAFPVIREVADFWVSRITHNRTENRYEILSVTGPNEAIVDVDNDTYTNAVAKRTLEVAAEAARVLGETPNPDWARMSERIYIPFDSKKQFHPEHAADVGGRYAHQLILLTYPLEMDSSETAKRNDLEACLKNFGKPGYEVGMLANFYSIVASELGERDLAYRLFLSMLRSYAKPPYYAMTETPASDRAVFLTAEGAFLQQIIFGFTGLRFTNERLAPKYRPLLPPTWVSLELRRIHLKGRPYNVRVERGDKLTMEPVEE